MNIVNENPEILMHTDDLNFKDIAVDRDFRLKLKSLNHKRKSR